jgi:hypothetical protein
VKHSDCEADHSPPANAEAKKMCTPPYNFMALCKQHETLIHRTTQFMAVVTYEYRNFGNSISIRADTNKVHKNFSFSAFFHPCINMVSNFLKLSMKQSPSFHEWQEHKATRDRNSRGR